MLPLFRSWLDAVKILHPTSLISLFSDVAATFVRALQHFFLLLGWVLCVEVALLFLFGEHILALAKKNLASGAPVNILLVLAYLGASIAGLVLHAGLLLLIRRVNKKMPVMEYFKYYFFRYIQLALSFSFIFILFFMMLPAFGITQAPTPHWGFLVSIRVLEIFTLFYWLDSTFRFKEIFLSLERATNFLLYNLPAVLIIIALFGGLQMLAKLFIPISFSDLNLLLASGGKIDLVAQNFSGSIVKVIAIKYLFFFLEYLVITVFFVLYKKNKEISYGNSLFE